MWLDFSKRIFASRCALSAGIFTLLKSNIIFSTIFSAFAINFGFFVFSFFVII